MSQQSLASKKITKRNVAQSSVIFSVVVAVITLGVIATVAYVDIKEEIASVSTEKSISEMIAEQKLRAEENRQQAELTSQAEDLVFTMDQRVQDLKQLEAKVNEVKEQLSYVTTSLKTVTDPDHQELNYQGLNQQEKNARNNSQPVIKFHTVKAVQQINEQNSNAAIEQYLNSIFDQNNAFKIDSNHMMTASGEAFIEISWLFKARGSMNMREEFLFSHQLNSQNQWNAKTF